MPGLLDLQPDQWGALGLLGQGISNRNFSGGATAAIGYLDKSKEDAIKQQYVQAQMANLQSEVEARKVKAAHDQAELERARRIQTGLPGLFQPQGMTGGAAIPQTEGGVPMFSKPMGVGPMQSTPGGFDALGAVRLGMGPDDIKKYSEIPNLGRPKVARTVKAIGPDGKEYEYQMDEFGQRVGDGMAQFKAPHYQDLGGQVGVFDGYGGRTGSLGKSQSPDSIAGNAVTIRGQNLTDARAKATAEMGGIPSGYRRTMTGGLEFIPGGPADPNTPKSKANLTEDQGKATGWLVQAENAWKNMQKVGLDASGNPTEDAKPGFTDAFAAIRSGGFTGGVANWMRGEDRQKYMQASSSLSEALLRAATGAGVNMHEAEQKIKELTPVIGDSDAVVKQKMASIPLYIDSLRVRAGPGAVRADAITARPPPVQSPSGLGSGTFGIDSNAIAAELARRRSMK